jgi:hypothetical protein
VKNPIIYSDREKKYIVWVSYWGIKIMKYFVSPESAINYVELNPNRCMGFKNPATKEELKLWLSDLESIFHSETEKDECEEQKIGFPQAVFAALILFALWLQPWESPAEKVSDEWKNCNNKYDGQCSYIGKKFKTNSLEMFISESLHGEYGDN